MGNADADAAAAADVLLAFVSLKHSRCFLKL